jgi:hypothetical protein
MHGSLSGKVSPNKMKITHKGKPFTVLLPPDAKKKFIPAFRKMMKYFSKNGRIRERGTPPDYQGYLFHINLGDKSIFREIFRSFSEYLGDMIANLSLLSH